MIFCKAKSVYGVSVRGENFCKIVLFYIPFLLVGEWCWQNDFMRAEMPAFSFCLYLIFVPCYVVIIK